MRSVSRGHFRRGYAITSCSKKLLSHDRFASVRNGIPQPAILEEDISALADWGTTISHRDTKTPEILSA